MLDLGRCFLAWVERSPDQVALVDGDLRLTYGEWFEYVAALAGGLQEIGLQRGDHLVALLQNRWEMATLHWACQFAGIIITPLNWRAKPDEIDYCADDANARAIVFQDVSAEAVRDSVVAQGLPRRRSLIRMRLSASPKAPRCRSSSCSPPGRRRNCSTPVPTPGR